MLDSLVQDHKGKAWRQEILGRSIIPEENSQLLGRNLIRLNSSILKMADIYFAGNRLVFWAWVYLSAHRASISTIEGKIA